MPTTYGTATSFTVAAAAATLANAAATESAAVTTDVANNVNDYRIIVKPTLGATALAGMKAVFVWIKTSEDGGTTWTGNATTAASGAAITLDAPHQFPLGCVIPFGAVSVARGASFSLKAACGGSLPSMWGIIIENQTGDPFTALVAKYREEYS